MKLKRLVAGVLSAAMLLSVSSTLAFAAEDTNVTVETDTDSTTATITVTSELYLSTSAVTAPTLNYTYTLKAGSAGTYTVTDDTDNSTTTGYIVAGDIAAASLANGVSDEDSSESTLTTSVDFGGAVSVTSPESGSVSFTFTAATFGATGIYSFILTEGGASDNSADTTNYVAGLNNEEDQDRYIYVTVLEENDVLVISQIIMTKGDIVVSDDSEGHTLGTKNTDYAKSAGYVHSYGIGGDDEDDDEPNTKPETTDTDTFTVSFVTFGDMAESTQDFDFTVIASGLGAEFKDMKFEVDDGNVDTSYYYIAELETNASTYRLVLATKENGEYTKVTTVDEAYATLALSDTRSFTIKAVIEDMTFSVKIDVSDGTYTYYYRDGVAKDATTNDWTATTTGEYLNSDNSDEGTTYAITAGGVNTVNFAAAKGSDAQESDDKGIEYSASFPSTGVVLDLAPYAIMMVLAAGFISLRFVRVARKEEE